MSPMRSTAAPSGFWPCRWVALLLVKYLERTNVPETLLDWSEFETQTGVVAAANSAALLFSLLLQNVLESIHKS